MNWSGNVDINYLLQIKNGNIVLRGILCEGVKTNSGVVQQKGFSITSQSCDLNTIISAQMLLTTLLLSLLTPPTGPVFIDTLVFICYICHENTTLQNFRSPHTDSNHYILISAEFLDLWLH